jgi:hypothetical protein
MTENQIRLWINFHRSYNKHKSLERWKIKLLKDNGFDFSPHAKSNFLSFEEARTFVRNLNLKNQKGWNNYCKSKNSHQNIPNSPEDAYKNDGWISLSDWLGTNNLCGSELKKQFLSFKEARNFVHSLNLKGTKYWKIYCKSGKKPINIPSGPSIAYKDSGWVSWCDWIGVKERFCKNYMSFKEARKEVQSLKLKSVSEWLNYNKLGKRPINIPLYPRRVYKSEWLSWTDWLGKNKIDNKQKYGIV